MFFRNYQVVIFNLKHVNQERGVILPRKKVEINQIRGERLRELMESHNLTNEELARLTNYSNGHISYMKNGARNITEDAARTFIEKAFPEIRIEWLMGYDNFRTEQEKTLSEQRDERVTDLINNMAGESLFCAKMAALKAYFRFYSLKTVLDCEWVLPDRFFLARKSFETKHHTPNYFPENVVREGTVFRITSLFDDKKVYSECTGTQLIELADRLLEFAEFELHKFVKQIKKTSKSGPDENETEEST